MPEPIVSIIVPCYNQGHYLQAAIESCLQQTTRELEVIVVNDGSTDCTEFVMQAAAERDPRVRTVSGANAGLGAARNRGLAAARGRYVNFLDADDLLVPAKLERQIAILEARPDVGLVLCDILSIDAGGRRLPDPGIHLDRIDHPDGLLVALLETGLFPPHVPLVRADLVAAAGGFAEDRALAGHADYLLWLTLALHGARVAIVPEVLALYRRTPAGMSSDAAHMSSSRAKVLALLAERYPDRLADGILTLASLLNDARSANVVLQARVRAQTDRAVEYELARVRFENWVLKHRDGRIQVWGAGSKGREVLGTLGSLGIRPAAFIDSTADGHGSLAGIPIHRPESLIPGDASVIVASTFYSEIVARLASLRVTDYCVAP